MTASDVTTILNHPAVVTAYNSLAGLTRGYLSSSEQKLLKKAFHYGAEAHRKQFRKSGEPYITHPLTVASILAELNFDINTLCAAILHDTIEDTEVTEEDLVKTFNKTVAYLVQAVTKLDKLKFRNLKEAQAESFVKMLFVMADDLRVIIIKLADRLHNMRTISAMSESSRKRISRETLEVFAPIAERLGLKKIQNEIQELAFWALLPNIAEKLSLKVKELSGNRKEAIKKIQKKISKSLLHSSLNAEVEGRQKTLYSIYKKQQEKNLEFDQIHDVFGVRVIVKSVQECYIALGVIHGLYAPRENSFKDYIAVPKTNGYQSIHTLVTGPYGLAIEVQIRTSEMDKVCESGVAAHWMYKNKSSDSTSRLTLARNWLGDLLHLQKETGSSLEFYENMKKDLIMDEIYVFTPRGKIIQLPLQSTALDFAYAIHTSVGNTAVSAEINSKPASLKQKLQTGQTVKINTSETNAPKAEWLNIVTTSKARTAIRHELKQITDQDAVQVGHKMLDRALDTYGLSFDKLDDKTIQKALKYYKKDSMDDLLKSFAFAELLPSIAAKKMLPLYKQRGLAKEYLPKEAFSITGKEGSILSYPQCCEPLPDDEIVGYMSPIKGIVVHRKNCPNLEEMEKNPERMIVMKWDLEQEVLFRTTIQMDVINKLGVLAKLASIVAENHGNIERFDQVDRDGNYSGLEFHLSIANKMNLKNILYKLRQLPEVLKASRKEIG
ncbi:MAG TPA: bifunctional (p)ppGpp synthetase/guanosine-3',5'-bis(diphosphate) 3'-pyrophosphohydrolase [Gammaproteobacteria bacterium]|nr:bifunctional (p)ppGpp synthetase/guanosine-3',5'-bis(diphosphate) 3'-pyrophosphohydrolase [Xanthomonadales bacterium]MCB1593530.1 bifunctional (p)ppGpp synthetase/guanosine-3',5'-bis(diphosphate) 3'-pyrophosphohydrolase [Xanthomonadales bacterium]HOP21868.1 bifunctional (p)ppGpp synthetase/guanosine-3',5'-bis(diphosphate) 3'-pyrophosphohydrolase [Gammaproteobacteria bacterium]HPI95431.1 bifunctional (p)ppGpp synthetase/guanosine-3',5'-bis(diphosphate) 3'-pyrophosphohydrolase [Gammaproteobacte